MYRELVCGNDNTKTSEKEKKYSEKFAIIHKQSNLNYSCGFVMSLTLYCTSIKFSS